MTEKIVIKPFYIEIFFVLVTLTFCCAVLTALYVGVAKCSRESRDKENTVLAVQSQVERFFAVSKKDEALKVIGIPQNKNNVTKGFDKDWAKTTQDPYYTVKTDIAAKKTDSGELITISIKVERNVAKDGEPFYYVSTQKFFAGRG